MKVFALAFSMVFIPTKIGKDERIRIREAQKVGNPSSVSGFGTLNLGCNASVPGSGFS
jgi:hypothetical protein